MTEDKSRARLGRGLASLIGGAGDANREAPAGFAPRPFIAQPQSSGERKVPISALVPNPRNPRRTFEDADHAELVASVRNHGVVQPILARKVPGQSELEIVAGERRWRAARAAGLSDVPVVIRDISDRESLEIALIENVQRADLNAIEEALGYEMLIDEHGYTQADLADILGKSRSHVANTLRLLKLPEHVRTMVIQGELAPGAARSALSAQDPEAFARQVVTRGMSVREAERLARGEDVEPVRKARRGTRGRQEGQSVTADGHPGPAEASTSDEDTMALEKLLSEALKMGVSVRLKGEGGTLALDFRSLEQLDELCRLLQGGVAAA